MTTSRLTARLDKVSLQIDPQHRPMVVRMEDGESAQDAMMRSGVTWPVAVMPWPCATNEEWLRLHARKTGGTA